MRARLTRRLIVMFCLNPIYAAIAAKVAIAACKYAAGATVVDFGP
ncbi:MAG TPA: hypothetical protein VGS05_11630 [Candidatus Sulfotelmatobacter sp.]|nr:hypothetical protein [Candidatus Sulfotelmatobacter sp.]